MGFLPSRMAVTNLEKIETCSKYNPDTSWCRSYSQAMIKTVANDPDNNLRMAQFINIPDASDGHFLFAKYQPFEIVHEPAQIKENSAQLFVHINQQMMAYNISAYGAMLEIKCDDSCNCSPGIIV